MRRLTAGAHRRAPVRMAVAPRPGVRHGVQAAGGEAGRRRMGSRSASAPRRAGQVRGRAGTLPRARRASARRVERGRRREVVAPADSPRYPPRRSVRLNVRLATPTTLPAVAGLPTTAKTSGATVTTNPTAANSTGVSSLSSHRPCEAGARQKSGRRNPICTRPRSRGVTSGGTSAESSDAAHATRRRPCRQRNMRGIKSGRSRQMRLPLEAARTWGGARKGAGRKPRGRPSMPHVTRPKIDPRCPVQVTIRATPGLPSLRSARVFGALRRAIARASVDRFRVIHFSIQQDHGHFIVEGDEARRARGGVHGLAIRLALAVNRALGRRGKVVGDRYHARPLTTPRHMRASMVYVLLNFRKHLRAPAGVDPRSSGPHFSGWHHAPVATDVAPATALPQTWMARVGWRRAGGPLRVEEHPAAAPRPHPT